MDSPKYKCSNCNEPKHEKTISFFTTDDHKTTIGVARYISVDNSWDIHCVRYYPVYNEIYFGNYYSV